jgi:hypothetical protein
MNLNKKIKLKLDIMKTRFSLKHFCTCLCIGLLTVLIPVSVIAQREGRAAGGGQRGGAAQTRQPVSKPAGNPGKPAQGGVNQRHSNTKPADNKVSTGNKANATPGDKSRVQTGDKSNGSGGNKTNVSGGNKTSVSTGNKTNVSGNNVNVNNSKNNVNVNNSKNVNINKSTVVVANPRPYPRPPYAYGGHAYYCYHPYAYHPYSPYRWGPVWHPVGFIIATMAATAIIVTVASQQYHYDQGVYYVPASGGYTVVPAPVGATIVTLPPGSQTVVINETTNNYYYGGTYYVKSAQGYTVVQPTAGAVVQNLPEGGKEVKIGEVTYVQVGETYYQPIVKDGKNMYEVVEVKESK